jgi:MFS family permease
MASFLYYHYDKSIRPKKTYFLMPCSDLFIYFFLTLGAKMGNKIGVRLTICVALIFKFISYALLLMFANYYIVLISMCLFGVGSGLGNLTYMKNSWKYFLKSQGLVNGIILGGAGISSSILTPLADFFIINPDKIPANEDTGIYEDEEIANRVPKYIAILCVMFLILGILSIFMTFPYNEENEEQGETVEEANTVKKESPENEARLIDLFLSSKNLKLLSFCFCGFCK